MEEVTKKHFLLLFFFFRETDGSLPFFSLIFSPPPAAFGAPKSSRGDRSRKRKEKSQKSFSFFGFQKGAEFFSSLLSIFQGRKICCGAGFFPFPLPPSFSGPEGRWVQGRKLRFPVKNRREEEKRKSLNGRPLNASSPPSAADTDRSILRQKKER